jgi:GNAT superfamily N-acetyltransferase
MDGSSLRFAAMASNRAAATIRPLLADDLDAAAELLAARHRRHRATEPLLDPAFEDPAVARTSIAAMLDADKAAGVAMWRDGELAGYLVGVSKDESVWGGNVWVEAAGHAVVEPALVRELYAATAGDWVAAGRTNHHVLAPASDPALVEAWFNLDFGQQHLHAVREVPGGTFGVVPRSELVVRRATPDDIEPLIELERVLPVHLQGSPVFSRLPLSDPAEVRAELEEDLGGSTFTYWVADHDGRVVGSAIGCALEVSPGHQGPNRPRNAAFLAYAAVLPDARGLGVGKALGETVLAWARDAGFESVATDWRSTNIEADRAWRAMGFRPTFRRLHRSIA